MGRPNKGLSKNKNRYNYENVLDADGIPISGLWKRLNKFYVQVSIVKDNKIVQRFLPLEDAPLEEITKKAQEIKSYWSRERAIHKSLTFFSIENFFELSSKLKPFEEDISKTFFDGATYLPSVEGEGMLNIRGFISDYNSLISNLDFYKNLNWKNIDEKEVEKLRNEFNFKDGGGWLYDKIKTSNLSTKYPEEDLKLIVSELLKDKNVLLT